MMRMLIEFSSIYYYYVSLSLFFSPSKLTLEEIELLTHHRYDYHHHHLHNHERNYVDRAMRDDSLKEITAFNQ